MTEGSAWIQVQLNVAPRRLESLRFQGKEVWGGATCHRSGYHIANIAAQSESRTTGPKKRGTGYSVVGL